MVLIRLHGSKSYSNLAVHGFVLSALAEVAGLHATYMVITGIGPRGRFYERDVLRIGRIQVSPRTMQQAYKGRLCDQICGA